MKLSHSPYRSVGKAFSDAARTMMRQNVPRDAAAISFFALFALFPAILVLIALVDAFLGWMDLHERVIQRIVALFPISRTFLQANFSDIAEPSTAVIISCLVVMIWSSSWIFSFAEDALNQAWGVSACRTFWESRVRNVMLLFLGGLLLLISAVFTGVVSTLRSHTAEIAGYQGEQLINWFWSFVLLAAGFLIAILVFTLLYRLIPDRRVPWLQVLSGAFVAAILWEIASYLFLKLVPYFDYQQVYGRTGAIIALLTWVYTSNLIMLFAANFSGQLYRTPLASVPQPPRLGIMPVATGESPQARVRTLRRSR